MRGSRSRLPARSALNALHRRAAPRLAQDLCVYICTQLYPLDDKLQSSASIC